MRAHSSSRKFESLAHRKLDFRTISFTTLQRRAGDVDAYRRITALKQPLNTIAGKSGRAAKPPSRAISGNCSVLRIERRPLAGPVGVRSSGQPKDRHRLTQTCTTGLKVVRRRVSLLNK